MNISQFKFTVATLTRQEGKWEIQRQEGHANHFVELLPGNLPLEMVAIPGGIFLMGSPLDEPGRDKEESPQHKVTVKPFFLGRCPVTQAQWRAVAALPKVERELNPDPSHFKGDSRPVERVYWYDAVEFCRRLAEFTGRPYRLPSEAEWEYACRAGTTTPFHFGEAILTELENYGGNRAYADELKGNSCATTPVDYFGVANAFGLSDMHGNVSEWCADHWHKSYRRAPSDGSAWLSEAEMNSRIVRGGDWYHRWRSCRSAYRGMLQPNLRLGWLGFRLCCSAYGVLS